MTKTDTKKLRPGFGARVRTTGTTLVGSVGGGFLERPEYVTIPAGGELPDNLADGEVERLDKLGAFTPVPSLAQRGLVEATPSHVALNTAPPGEAVTTPSDIRALSDDELSAQERLAQAQQDVRDAFIEAEAEAHPNAPLPGEPGAKGSPVSHAPAEGAESADSDEKPARSSGARKR